jgi:hypothetical protein
MLSILVGSFVIACCLLVIVLVTVNLRAEARKRREASEIILAAEPLRPEWIYGRRMDVPRRYPLLRTRSSKQLR